MVMQDEKSQVRVRFAPSPTGYLHIGGLRTALFNWLFARHYGGIFLIRIEDTDIERSKQEYTESILESLDWAGIKSDEPIVIQSERLHAHEQVIQQLLKEGKAYKCYCSQDDLVKRFNMQTEGEFFIRYDGYCRINKQDDTFEKKPFVIRFALPTDVQEISFDDLIRGRLTFTLDQFDDFIIARSDGRPIYNFVVVIDDAFMNITHVIRGEDHISNTPKQILLYKACGYAIPQFAHLPLILGPSGDRLSKRDAATSVLDYKKEGYLPEALNNYLVRLGWSYGDQEIFTVDELIAHFSLDAIGKKGAIFDLQKLAWVNQVYMRQKSPTQLLSIINQDVEPSFHAYLRLWDEQKIKQTISLYQERVTTLKALAHELKILHDGPLEFDPQDIKQWIEPETITYLQQVIAAFEKLDDFSAEYLSTFIKALAKQLNIKFVNIAQPIRIALIGKSSGPGIFDLLSILGKQKSIDRITALLTYTQSLQAT